MALIQYAHRYNREVRIDSDALRKAIEFARAQKLPGEPLYTRCEAEKQFAIRFLQMLDLMTSVQVNRELPDTVGFVGLDHPHDLHWHLEKPHETITNRTVCFYNGGLIHHGPTDNGSGATPALTCDLSRAFGRNPDDPVHDWGIHT
jgi:hypothetical protein